MRLQYKVSYYEPTTNRVNEVRAKRHQLLMTEVEHLKQIKQKELS